jgi:kynurenine formamidase
MGKTTVEGRLPSYSELPGGNAAGVFGLDDTLGSLNRLTPHTVANAATLIRRGTVFNLNAPLEWPSPPLFSRKTPEHHVMRRGIGRDDYLNSFYLQSSSQWDGFLHIIDPESKTSYNGATDESPGIETWSQRGIAGRGVLIDVAAWAESRGAPIDWESSWRISVADLEECVAWEGVEIREGDVLIVRTGWTAGYEAADEDKRRSLGGASPAGPGLEASHEMAARLWDWGIAAVASDCPTVEAWPRGEPFLHVLALVRLGIPFGELWWTEELAADCANDGQYDFFFTSAPLNLSGGIGSPANALAIK